MRKRLTFGDSCLRLQPILILKTSQVTQRFWRPRDHNFPTGFPLSIGWRQTLAPTRLRWLVYSGWFDEVVTAMVTSTKLSYVKPISPGIGVRLWRVYHCRTHSACSSLRAMSTCFDTAGEETASSGCVSVGAATRTAGILAHCVLALPSPAQRWAPSRLTTGSMIISFLLFTLNRIESEIELIQLLRVRRIRCARDVTERR